MEPYMIELVEVPPTERLSETPRWTPPDGNRVEVGPQEDTPEDGGADE